MDHVLFKQIRVTLGLGQVEFAEMLEISASYVAMIETGRRLITPKIENKVREEVDEELIQQVDKLLNLRFVLESKK
mgnify:CR=1 FL=1